MCNPAWTPQRSQSTHLKEHGYIEEITFCQMTLKPRFWGCCFFKTCTGTAFDSEQLCFYFRVWTEPKIYSENSSASVQ